MIKPEKTITYYNSFIADNANFEVLFLEIENFVNAIKRYEINNNIVFDLKGEKHVHYVHVNARNMDDLNTHLLVEFECTYENKLYDSQMENYIEYLEKRTIELQRCATKNDVSELQQVLEHSRNSSKRFQQRIYDIVNNHTTLDMYKLDAISKMVKHCKK